MRRLPLVLARGTLGDAAVALAVLGAMGAALTVVEAGSAPRPVGLLVSLVPVALGVATGTRFGRSRTHGELDGWMALGGSPRALVGPVLSLAALGGLCALAFPLASASVPLPAPVAPGLEVWWADGWTAPPALRWQTPPGDLGLFALAQRWWEGAPPGARATVDAAEILRRVWFAAACPLAVLAGAWLPLRGGPKRAAGVVRAAFAGAVGPAAWLLLGVLAVGACS